MARTVKLEIDAKVTGLVNGLKTAQRATQDSAREFDKWSAKHEESLDTVGKGMVGFGAVAAAGAGLAVKKFADFDKAMSGVQAATHETEANMGLLRQAAIDAGADTAFSAQEAAAGIEELAKAGVSTRDVIGGGLTGALDLAAAGQLSVGESAEIAASAMTQFKLSGDQIPHLADLLAAGAGKAQGSVHDLGEALNQAGLVASATGLTIEETTGGLAAFASAGLTGSDAGTSFKTMLQRLTPQSKEAQQKFDELGISAYDAQGNFVGLTDFAGQLQTKMSKLTPEARNAAMSVMFGSDAVRASNVLYEQGAKGIQSWIDQVNDAGFAADTAALLQNNLAGDLEKLGGAFDTVFIQSGGAANDALRGLVQGAEAVVDVIGKIPAPILGMGTMFAGVAGGAALLAGGVINVLPKIRDTRDAMNDLFPAGSKGAAGIGKVGKAMGSLARGGAVAGGILAVGTGLAKIAEATYLDDIAQGTGRAANGLADMVNNGAGIESLNSAFQKIDGSNLMDGTDGIGAMDAAIKQLFADDPGTKFDNWGQRTINSLTGIKGTTQIAEEAFGTLDTELANMLSSGNADGAASAFEMIQKKLRDSGVSAEEAAYLFPAYSDALQKADAEAKNAAGGTGELEGALAGVGGEAEETAASLDDIIASLFELGVLTRDVRSAEADFEAAIDGVTSSIAENGKSLDITTEKGRNNQAALDGLAASGQAYTESLAQSGASEKELQASMQGTYDSLISAAGQFGITGDKAKALAAELIGVPDGVDVQTWMDDSAKAMAEATANAIELIPGYTKVSVAVSEDGTVGQVQSRINEITGKTEYVFVTDDGTVQNVQAGIASIDGKDVPVYVGDDGTVYSTQGKINGIQGKNVTITADAATGAAEAALNWVARPRSASVTMRQSITRSVTEISNGPVTGQFGKADGGRVGRYASGGRLPRTGLGTDMILGIGSDGMPTARVDDGEWVITQRSASKYDRVLGMINRDDPAVQGLAGLASGGQVGRAEKRVQSAQKAYNSIDSKKANKARKQAAKARLDDAKADLKAAREQAKASAEARKAERERLSRVNDERRELRTDIRRGEITDSFTSGSGLSQVDKLYDLSRNADLSKGARNRASKDAQGLEKALSSLTKRSEGLEKALEAAKEKADELRAVRDAVANDLRGEFSLSGMLDNTRRDLGSNPFTAKSIRQTANRTAANIQRFANKLNRLRQLGFGETIIQEIAALGTADGSLAADALIKAPKKERDQVVKAYDRLDRASNNAGQYVTESMYRGGLDAADGLVKGLQSKSKTVDSAFYKLGKDAEKAFRRSLDMHSPSRTLAISGVDSIDGVIVGAESKRQHLISTYASMGDDVASAYQPALGLAIPPSYEVARYAQAQSAPVSVSPEAIAQAVQAGMAGWQPMVQIDGRQFYGTMQQVNQQYGKRR